TRATKSPTCTAEAPKGAPKAVAGLAVARPPNRQAPGGGWTPVLPRRRFYSTPRSGRVTAPGRAPPALRNAFARSATKKGRGHARDPRGETPRRGSEPFSSERAQTAPHRNAVRTDPRVGCGNALRAAANPGYRCRRRTLEARVLGFLSQRQPYPHRYSTNFDKGNPFPQRST